MAGQGLTVIPANTATGGMRCHGRYTQSLQETNPTRAMVPKAPPVLGGGLCAGQWKKINDFAMPPTGQGPAQGRTLGVVCGQAMRHPALKLPWARYLLLYLALTATALPWMGLAPAWGANDTLQRSREQLRQFPFRPDCGGNTREMEACLWQRRDQTDSTLAVLLVKPEILERWRASRREVCGQAALKASGGSVHPIVWLSCENALNQELLRQIRRPLLQSADL